MHDGDELRSESGLYILGDMFNGGGDGVLGGEWGGYNDAQAFDLEISLVQGFEGASVVEVMVERDGEMGVRDGGDRSESTRLNSSHVVTSRMPSSA